MCSALTERYDQGLSNKPSYMLLSFLVLEIFLKQSKSTKHLTGFLRHCTSIVPIPMAWIELPPKPLTVKGEIGLSDLKSPCFRDMWQFVPELRIKGIVPM
jgi:hypothetical protein